MLLRTQSSGMRYDFGAALATGVTQEVLDTAFKAFQRGALGEPPFTIAEIGHIRLMANMVLGQGFASQLAALSLVKHRDAALQIIEGWKLYLGVFGDAREFTWLVQMLLDVVDADPVLGDKPFDKDNKALRRIVRTGLKEFPIIHDAFVEKIVDHALKSEPDEELADYDQEAVQSYKLNLAREWTNYVKKHPNLVGNHEEASYVLVEVAMSARLTVEIARKTSKGQQVNFLNKLLTNMDQAEGEDSN